MKPQRFNLGPDAEGLEYGLPCGISVRRFDRGNVVWFYVPKTYQKHPHRITVHFRPAGHFEWQKKDEWKVTVTFYNKNNRYLELYGNGTSRREAFDNVRIEIANAKNNMRKFN